MMPAEFSWLGVWTRPGPVSTTRKIGAPFSSKPTSARPSSCPENAHIELALYELTGVNLGFGPPVISPAEARLDAASAAIPITIKQFFESLTMTNPLFLVEKLATHARCGVNTN
jgi:hypothetical protein